MCSELLGCGAYSVIKEQSLPMITLLRQFKFSLLNTKASHFSLKILHVSYTRYLRVTIQKLPSGLLSCVRN